MNDKSIKLPRGMSLNGIEIEITCYCGNRFWIRYIPTKNINETVCKNCQKDHMDLILLVESSWK